MCGTLWWTAVTQRWQRRPDGSTWGDWGDDDELGRINLITPEKVLQGVREVEAGISFCLSLPLDFPGGTALNQRRPPPRVAPTEDMEGVADTFYNVHMSEMPDFGDPKIAVAILAWRLKPNPRSRATCRTSWRMATTSDSLRMCNWRVCAAGDICMNLSGTFD